MVKYRWKASRDLSIGGKMGMHPWKMKMEMKRLMPSLRRSDYSHEIRSYLLLVRYKLRYDPDADTKLDTFDGRRFPGGVPGTTRPPGGEPRGSTCNAPIGPPCPRGGSPPGTAPGVERSPGRALGWQTATATRGGSLLSPPLPRPGIKCR